MTAEGTASSRGSAAPRRRPAGAWLLAGAGALAALAFGLVTRMHDGAPLVMMTLGGATVAACGVALWRVVDALLVDGGDSTPQTRGRLRELEREKKAVLRALKEIDLDHRMRKLDDGDHDELVRRYRARALSLMAEIEDAGDIRRRIERDLMARLQAPATGTSGKAAPHAAAKPSSRVCPECSTSNDPDARFCKQCATPLG